MPMVKKSIILTEKLLKQSKVGLYLSELNLQM